LRRLAAGLLIALASASFTLTAGIAEIPWNQSNIETLRSFDKAAVVRFLNEQRRKASR